MAAAAVTPAGVRDGNPDALAGLCARRGPAVLAYCERLAGEEHAMAAAADAFRRFRAAVVAATDPTDLNPEVLLLSATRQAAADHVPRPPDSPDVLRFVARRPATGWCGDVPGLLAARADRAISRIDLARLEQHLAGCPACRAPEARFQAAERAYRNPPDAPLPLPVTAAIMSALASAAPVGAAQAAANGAGTGRLFSPNGVVAAADVPQPAPLLPAVFAAPEPPAPAVSTPAEPPAPPAPAPPPAPPEPPATEQHVREPQVEAAPVDVVATAPEPPARPDERPTPRAEEPTSEYRIPDFVDLGRRERAEAQPDKRKLAVPSLPSLGSVRARLPARTRPDPGAAPMRLERRPRPAVSAPALNIATILPIVLVVGAIIVGLAVAGVFGGGGGADPPATQAPAPAAPAGDTEPPDVIVVPGGDASAADVEAAKARARAKARRAARQQTPDGSDAPTGAQDSSVPADAAPAPPPPPPPVSQSQDQGSAGSDGTPQVDGGSGAATPSP